MIDLVFCMLVKSQYRYLFKMIDLGLTITLCLCVTISLKYSYTLWNAQALLHWLKQHVCLLLRYRQCYKWMSSSWVYDIPLYGIWHSHSCILLHCPMNVSSLVRLVCEQAMLVDIDYLYFYSLLCFLLTSPIRSLHDFWWENLPQVDNALIDCFHAV